jgi:DNA-binding MarR family transcriptional regulator
MTDTPTLTQSIGQAERALQAVLNKLLVGTATTFPQWAMLSTIARGGAAVPHAQLLRQVASALKIDEPTVAATLDGLTARGFVTTSTDDPASVRMTATGEAHFHSLRQSIEGVTTRLYGDLPPDDLATVRRVLGLVTERANAELGRNLEP